MSTRWSNARATSWPSPSNCLPSWAAAPGWKSFCTKDGRVFDNDLKGFDCIAFYTSSGDLTQPNKRNDPPISLDGKKKLLDAIAGGKPFVGFHAATCSFRSKQIDPYIKMLGAEFIGHGAQQRGKMQVTSPKFPGLNGCGASFTMKDEWYAMNRYDPQMHVILVQETAEMVGEHYKRPPYPATWAKMHGKGRVFYTSMGHRADVWTNKTFQDIAMGGLAWALGNADADITPNFRQVTPEAPTA